MEGLSANAKADAPRGEVTVDDATLFLAEFKNGALGSFEATRFANGHKNGMSFEINGSKGSLRFEFERMNELWYYSSEDPEGTQGFRLIQATESVHPYASAWWPVGHVIGYEHTFVHELYEFVEAIAHDKKTCPDFNDGVKCSQILEAVDLSIEERQWVEVDSL
jgi:predicted dehydrogenase